LSSSNALDQLLITGPISGAGNITLSGNAVHLWRNSVNTFVGNLFITNTCGLQVNGPSCIPDTCNVYISAGASLQVFGAESINVLLGDGLARATQGHKTLTIGAANGSGVFTGIIKDISDNNGPAFLDINKAGTGTQVFTGDSSASTGTTTVSGGVLAIDNTSGSGTSLNTINIMSGGTMAGTGIVSSGTSPMTIDGTLLVGDPGHVGGSVLTVDNNTFGGGTPGTMTVDASGSLSFALFSGAGGGDNSGNPAAADVLNLGSPVALNPGSTLSVTNPTGLIGWTIGDKWKVINWNANPLAGTFTTVNLPSLGTTLVWDLSDLYAGGTISVIAAPPRPIIGLTRGPGSITLTWSGGGFLQAAPAVTGVYTNVPNAPSPFVITNFSAPSLFYRIFIP
jgi:autotransporter-associated beta strand protein